MPAAATAPQIAWDDEPRPSKPGPAKAAGPQIAWDDETPQGQLDAALRTGQGIEKFTAQPTTAVPGGKTAGAVLPRVETFHDQRMRAEAEGPQAMIAPGLGAAAFIPGGTEPATGQKLNPLDLDQASRIGHATAAENDAAMLSRAVRGRGATWGDRADSFGLHALASGMDLAAGATTPMGAAVTAGSMIAPEVVGPVMAAKGAVGMGEHAGGAFRLPAGDESLLNPLNYFGNPDELEPFLQNASQAAGGTAMTGAAIKPGYEAARAEGASVPRAIERGLAETNTGRAVSAVNKNVVQPIAERVTTPPAPKALRQAIQPGVNIPKAEASIATAGPRIQQLRKDGALVDREGEPLTEIKSTGQLADAVKASKAHVWDKVEEMTGPVNAVKADTTPVAKAMEQSISGRTSKQFGAEAQTIRDRAATYRGQMSLRDIENAIQDANDDLKGFYQRSAGSSAPTSAGMRATLAEVKALRSLLDDKVSALQGPGFRQLKQEYGALRDVERATAKADFVAKRQKGMPLYEALAALRAAGDFATGNVLSAARGAATIAMGKYLQKLRDPNFLIESAFHGPQAFQAAEALPVQAQMETPSPMRPMTQRALPANPPRALLPSPNEPLITPHAAPPEQPRLSWDPTRETQVNPQRRLPSPRDVNVLPSSGERFTPGARRALPAPNPIDTAAARTPETGIRTIGKARVSPNGEIVGVLGEAPATLKAWRTLRDPAASAMEKSAAREELLGQGERTRKKEAPRRGGST